MARKNGYSEGNLIQNPIAVIESIIRDWILAEFNLICRITTGDVFFDNLNYPVDSYYVGAIVVNHTKNEQYNITVSTAGKQVALDDYGTLADGDYCTIKNILGGAQIDTDSFDALLAQTSAGKTGTTSGTYTNKLICAGKTFTTDVLAGMTVHNTTDDTYTYVRSVISDTELWVENDIFVSGEDFDIYGSRHGWKFDRSLINEENSMQILDQLCYESHCILFNSYDTYRIMALEGGNVSGTLNDPMILDGEYGFYVEPTPLDSVKTSFILHYDYDYTRKKYLKQLSVNKNSSSDTDLDSYKTTCLNAENTYKVKNVFEYSSDWIHDDFTAVEFLKRKIESLSYQRLKIKYTGEVKDLIQFEKGDRMLIDFDLQMPTGKNNSQQFLIIGDELDIKKKVMSLILLY